MLADFNSFFHQTEKPRNLTSGQKRQIQIVQHFASIVQCQGF